MSAVFADRAADVACDLPAWKRGPPAGRTRGDLALAGTTLQIVGETLAEAADVRAGDRVLDVAAGNGNATLAAARRYADVMSTDHEPALLEQGHRRAGAEGLLVQFRHANADALPFRDGGFDIVLSSFGAMFAPDHAAAAAEMLRVLRRGGRIALASWTPQGLVGRWLDVAAAHVPGLAGRQAPALWGTEAHLRQLFGSRLAQLRCRRQLFNFRCRSATHGLQVLRDLHGPTRQAFAALDAAGQAALADALLPLLDAFDDGRGTLVAPAEYLEAVIQTRRVW